MNRSIKLLYKKISEKHGIPISKVQEVVEHQFKYIRQVMAQGIKNDPTSFKTIQITHLGKFAPRKYKLEEYKRKADNK